MSYPRTLSASAALALALGGCMGTQNRGIESVQQPVIERASYAFDLATSGDGLAQGERARLAGWLDALRLGYGDRVSVDDPEARNELARAEIGGVVAGYGLLLADGAPVTEAAIAPGTVRVVVDRARASVPRCPDWSRNSSADLEAHTSSNFGCAVNGNLAAMVADPADLIRGRSGGEVIDTSLAGKAIDGYRARTGGSNSGAGSAASAGAAAATAGQSAGAGK